MYRAHPIRKLIAQPSGVLLGIAGLSMILEELQTAGLINLRPILSSGEISRGSVGLFLWCISLLLIALPALWGAPPIRGLRGLRPPVNLVTTRPFRKRLVFITAGALPLSIALLFGGER
jgi:hypothetical protein